MKMNLPVTGQEQRFSAEKNMVTKTNTKGIITFANKDFVEVSGFSEEELLGKNHNLITPRHAADRLRDHVEDLEKRPTLARHR